MKPRHGDWRDFTQNLAIRAILGVVLRIPYRARVPIMGWIVSRIVAPLAGWDRRIEDNLKRVCPELGFRERQALIRAVPDNAGRTLIEIYSGADFVNRVRETEIAGPGADTFRAHRAAGRAVIFVTGHFGNYDALRAALFAQGHPLAALYRGMRNAGFNDHYVRAISKIGEPVFPANRAGLVGMVKHLRGGNILGILVDVFALHGPELSFFGQPAPTALSAAEWALKYDAALMPAFAIRKESGLDFEIFIDHEIARGAPEAMMQAFNDSLEARVRAHMGQWFWIHRRWSGSKY